MDVRDRVAIVTGGGGGIGSALTRALVARGAKVLVADLDGAAAAAVAKGFARDNPGAVVAAAADVSSEDTLRELVARAERELGPVSLFFANAGVRGGGGLADEEAWATALAVNVHAHVRAARVLVPMWLERGEGYFVSTASAAGLLNQIGMAPYGVTKHAAVGFAEWLSITYGGRGIRVSCVCPMGVSTNLLHAGAEGDESLGLRIVAAAGEVLPPEEVAERMLESVASEEFLVLPHPEVLDFYRRKGADYDRWLAGMRRLQERIANE